MTDACLEYLKNDQGRAEIALKLAHYARGLLELHHGWSSFRMLPGGVDPEDIVLCILGRVASGKRKLNDRYPFEVQLKGMIRSIISKLYQKTDAKLETLDLDEEDVDYTAVTKALTVGGKESPFESQEYSKKFLETLMAHPKVKKDPELIRVINAYAAGISSASEASKETGIPVERIYEYNRNLKPLLREIQKQLELDGS